MLRNTSFRARAALAAAGGAALAVLALWWALVGTARVAPVPAAPPDEGQELALYQAYLEALVQRRPEHWQARANLASLLADTGRAPEALPHLRQALRRRKDDRHLLRQLARTADAAGASGPAHAAWLRLAALEPGNVEARVRLADLYRELEWFALARAAAGQAVRLAPEAPEVLRAAAAVEYVAQDYRAALRNSRLLMRKAPENPVGYSIAAMCLRELGEWEEAIRNAERAVQLDPAVMDYRVELARLHVDRPDGAAYDRALVVLSDPGRTGRDELKRRYWKGVCLQRMGQPDAAFGELTAVRERTAGFLEVDYYLAKIYQQRGDSQKAQEATRAYQQLLARRLNMREAEAMVRSAMDSPARHLAAAKAALTLGEPERALFYCEAALRLKPGSAEAEGLRREATELARQQAGGGPAS